jgi:hypothetical protein
MKLDFLIPASPNDGFFSQIAFFRLALDALGGMYRKARVVAVFGDETVSALPSKWVSHFRNIEVAWVPPEVFKRKGYGAQGDHRYELFRPNADLVILCDADTVIMRSFTWTIARLVLTQSLAGVIAHYHAWALPLCVSGEDWATISPHDSARHWNIISKAVIGREIPLPHRYALQDPTDAGLCPFYINYGFFAGPPKIMSKFYARYREIRPKVVEIIGQGFCGQVSVSLTVNDLGLRTTALPMRFNFPNIPIADALYPKDLNSIVTFHYLRDSQVVIGRPFSESQFHRQTVFTSAEQMARFLDLSLVGSERSFQKFVLKLTGGRYPFEDSSKPNASRPQALQDE